MKNTQSEMIINHMLKGGKENGITSLQAIMTYGVGRLASRIHDLKAEGYNIQREMVEVEKADGSKATVARYWVDPENAVFTDYWYDLPRGVRVVEKPCMELHVQIFNEDGCWEDFPNARRKNDRKATRAEMRAFAMHCVPNWDERGKEWE